MKSISMFISQFDEMKDILHQHMNIVSEKLDDFEAKLEKIERYVKTKHIIEYSEECEEEQEGSTSSDALKEAHLKEKEAQEEIQEAV